MAVTRSVHIVLNKGPRRLPAVFSSGDLPGVPDEERGAASKGNAMVPRTTLPLLSPYPLLPQTMQYKVVL